ncbi:hypothetical protein PFISCL1PPCAC_28098 [Pristionchus fissidentatus]|uniref:DUF5862 domain-containing protein n=1 Tax=Pristionchus fissidentatus TaxID=1538716 RepID=A0AAV5X049_9BILA|nr:hypothetical protein PFISCL1PPCAC_28098 [Pristionchus fissidentatus]
MSASAFNMDGALERMQNPKELPAAATKAVTVMMSGSKAVLPAAVAIDTYRVAKAAIKDYQSGESFPKKTIKTGASVVGGWGGATAGMMSGAMIGSMLIPFVGSIVGSIVGGIAGGVGGSVVAKNATVNYLEMSDDSDSESDEE